MTSKQCRVGAELEVRGVRIIAVERVWASADVALGRVLGTGAKEPVAVVVRTPRGLTAFDLAGTAIVPDTLLRDVAGLREACEKPVSS